MHAKPDVSVITPVNLALATVRRTLFQPFDLAKWLALGFTAWLALLSAGGGLPGFNFTWPQRSVANPGQDYAKAIGWLQANIALVLAVAVPLALAALAVGLALAWISSRGKFMFMDNVAANRAEVRAVWRRWRVQGNSLFLFTIGFGLVSLALLAALLVTLLLVAAPDLARRSFGAHAIAALALGGGGLAAYLLALGCVAVFLDDFIVPIMRARDCRVMAAWSWFGELLKLRPGIFILYLLFRLVLQAGLGAAGLLLCCATCCLALLPYIGTVILLPAHVFLRAYALHFLEQFGAPYRFFAGADAPGKVAGYNGG